MVFQKDSLLQGYDKYTVAFSGGKDSTALVLYLLDCGIDRDKIELWHHDIDGREGSTLMDWPITRSYCQAFAKAFGITIYFSWKRGGFEAEMLRHNSLTGDICFESPTGLHVNKAKDLDRYKNTRLKFPQVSADLSVRYCSAYLKTDVMASALRNDERFKGIRTLILTGERGEESANRAKYKLFEPHKADLRAGKQYTRYIDHYRAILHWKEEAVWKIIEKHRIHAHPVYYLGFGRVSCMLCIFASSNQFATARSLCSEKFNRVAQYEKQFNVTIKRNIDLVSFADKGVVYADMDEFYKTIAIAEYYDAPIFIEDWKMPKGAKNKETCGPI